MAENTAATQGEGSAGPSSSASTQPKIDALVLDAAPLLTQQPLRGLAAKFYLPPLVLAELKDKRARDHLEFMRGSGQIDLEVREPGALALSKVIAFAKQTGDYAVLSAPDLQVLALTYAVEAERHGTWRIREQIGGLTGQQKADVARREAQQAAQAQASEADDNTKGKTEELESSTNAGEQVPEVVYGVDESEEEFQDAEDVAEQSDDGAEAEAEADATGFTEVTGGTSSSQVAQSDTPAAVDTEQNDDDDSDGGEWITADNIRKFKNIDLGIVQSESDIVATAGEPGDENGPSKGKKKGKGKGKGGGHMTVACMTADYAVQNVLLQMGLSLVSSDGFRITKVKSWVLRCHACFKICKDMERKFCPSCGNPTLLRTSVTTSAPGANKGDKNGGLHVHLKKNFQYRNRGTIYSLPQPRAGTASSLKKSAAKHQVPILREDQAEWQRAVAQQNVFKRKEEKALAKALEKGKDTLSARYEDPDWMPDMLLGGGRQANGGLPALGIGRKNPNEKRRPRK
ncbi:unnamed protein product [Tilletia controversa]|uniref:20S-pre-rRNA D-site endonuclease NOB1 n=3 Tax=Tilletia TaxID=13289 RepID=A0A8X7MT07_9BASI|nr:hypothetical protein CF336_g6375 [Tilletia laevis]KAE8190012.1 hypothetical protein CF328_g6104 [Tilletia controversa]KAE8257004.1 hypothetical protein A4X03_0g4841 [Tilletia caries]KAE8192995.1 hypothetical protein CF335_g5702 [Tilletia laevis]KAE8247768.1 hypothetical protein A4X06_0g4212 [Tilletia controversa]